MQENDEVELRDAYDFRFEVIDADAERIGAILGPVIGQTGYEKAMKWLKTQSKYVVEFPLVAAFEGHKVTLERAHADIIEGITGDVGVLADAKVNGFQLSYDADRDIPILSYRVQVQCEADKIAPVKRLIHAAVAVSISGPGSND